MRGRYEKDFGRLRKHDSSLTHPPKDDSPFYGFRLPLRIRRAFARRLFAINTKYSEKWQKM